MASESLENWEYNCHPNADSVRVECDNIIEKLKAVAGDLEAVFKDTRPSHLQMFSKVVPAGKPYMAGNYRGAPFPQLLRRPVFIAGFECAKPQYVNSLMAEFHEKLIPSLEAFRKAAVDWSPRNRIVAFCKLVAIFFANFLTIHPYANGNGHISRLLLWCIFTACSVNSAFWQVPNRNINPPDVLIAQYRMGNKQPLFDAFITLIEAENATIEI